MTFRYAEEKDAGLVLEFLKRLSEYEKAEEHLVSTAAMLAEELGKENGARRCLSWQKAGKWAAPCSSGIFRDIWGVPVSLSMH